jgi:hypothetical protein
MIKPQMSPDLLDSNLVDDIHPKVLPFQYKV